VVVDDHLRVVGHRELYAVGDCAAVPDPDGGIAPATAQHALREGLLAARNVAADLHGSDGASFDGQGMCFLELPGRRVAMVEGDFFAEPRPDVHLTEATQANFERKQAYERDRLAQWLG
jgi:NADH dehydrogenase FAD-containing subunit